MFTDKPIKYPDERLVLVRYLVPEIYVGPAMTANIMKANREVVHRLTYRGLKENEKSNQVHISLRKHFYNSTREIFGPDILPYEFPDVNLEDTPMYDMYENDTTDAEGDLVDKMEDNEIPLVST